MTNEEAFVRSICENPDDDSLRLIFADWLEEQGSLRGEFIRVQCALAEAEAVNRRIEGKGLRIVDDTGLDSLRARERELLNRHGNGWARSLAGVSGWSVISEHMRIEETRWHEPDANPSRYYCFDFRRGFVASITLPTQAFLDHAAALFQVAPLEEVRLVELVGQVDSWNEIVARQESERLLQAARVDCDAEGKVIADWSHTCVAYGRRRAGLPPLPVLVAGAAHA